jgi:hypothetical protein
MAETKAAAGTEASENLECRKRLIWYLLHDFEMKGQDVLVLDANVSYNRFHQLFSSISILYNIPMIVRANSAILL